MRSFYRRSCADPRGAAQRPQELKPDATIIEAPGSEEAMRLVVGIGPGPHLLDLKLPIATASRAGRAGSALPSISIVVLPAHDRANVVRALDLGALGFIPKTAQREVMISALNLVFSGGIYIPPEILVRQDPSAPGQPAPSRPVADRPGMSPADLGLTERQIEVLALVMQGKEQQGDLPYARVGRADS
jgi:DNA-binding NarL/FixJ family response regulator